MQNTLIIEDIQETGQWLCHLLDQAFPDATIKVCSDCNSTLHYLQNSARLNLVLLDISLPDGNGLDLIEPILTHSPEAYIVVSTIFDDENHILAALQAGAKGYLLKDSPDRIFIQKLRGILTGDPPLSPGVARKILHHFTLQSANMAFLAATQTTEQANEALLGQLSLSTRETEVLVLVAKGFSRKEVAKKLGLSTNTVARYIRDVYQKLNISSRAEAAVEACRLGLVNAA